MKTQFFLAAVLLVVLTVVDGRSRFLSVRQDSGEELVYDDELSLPKELSLSSSRGKITMPLKLIKENLQKVWDQMPPVVKDNINLDDFLNGLDKIFEVSDSIEDLIYRKTLELVRLDWLAWTITQAIMLLLPLR